VGLSHGGFRVGGVTVMPIYDGYRYVDARALRDKTVDDWRPHRQFVANQLRLRMDYGGFLVTTAGHVIIVDPGVALPNALDSGHFFESLWALSVRPAEVTHVVFTHRHMDHIQNTVAGAGPRSRWHATCVTRLTGRSSGPARSPGQVATSIAGRRSSNS
jgi:glyoxylase-like metal-dependent hydrolase (beta-lactamase superfamily II)